ncbi:unnamed protein product [Arctia plantaginis]|uniref:PiggyBac transposable element-derived protein domain-containing protein n=1 Tax=Arctia plantaginis TaxID=874455 RepID=A0A8S0Z738_ARCPL|nr:unnamed protein product [Arctia plantaginis]
MSKIVYLDGVKDATICPWRTDETPYRKRSSAGTVFEGSPKRRRTIQLRDENIINLLYDSGSDEGDDFEDGNDEDEDLDVINFMGLRQYTRQMRNRIVVTDPEDGWIQKNDANAENGHDVSMNERMINVQVECERMDEEMIHENVDVVHESDENTRGRAGSHERESGERFESSERSDRYERAEQGRARVNPTFSWSDEFSTFNAQKETYTRDPGPAFSSNDPAEYFYQVWDSEFMKLVVRETNLYAWQIISQFSDPDLDAEIPKYLEFWTEITVEELYRYFAVLILMSFCHRSNIREYWETGIMGMPEFREIMGRNRFQLISKFLHFTSNESLLTSGHLRKIQKVAPVVAHCNKKFKDLYTPAQHLSLDESLLLWKGRLSWKQCIRSKAARYGIKSFELCEAETGYLKSRCTDVLGTLNRRRNGIPPAVKDVMPNVPRGTTVYRHSGDITLVSWKDVKVVTVISTYHIPEMVPGRRFLLNTYIVYTKNPMYHVYSHRQFRRMLVHGLLSRYPRVSSGPHRAPSTPQLLQRLQPGQHFPVHTELASRTQKAKHKQLRCARCAAQNRRVSVTLMCKVCKVALCVGACLEEYHTLVNL